VVQNSEHGCWALFIERCGSFFKQGALFRMLESFANCLLHFRSSLFTVENHSTTSRFPSSINRRSPNSENHNTSSPLLFTSSLFSLFFSTRYFAYKKAILGSSKILGIIRDVPVVSWGTCAIYRR